MESLDLKKNILWRLQHYITLIAILLIFIIFTVITPRFIQPANLLLILKNMSPLLIQALGLTLVFVIGEIDLSIGVIATIGSAFCLGFMSKGLPIFAAIILTLLMGVLLGGLNGFFVGYLHFPSTITTLGTKLLFTGIVVTYTKGMNITNNIPLSFVKFGKSSVFGISTLIILSLAIFLILHLLMTRTKSSYHLYVAGTNDMITRTLGLNPNLLKLNAFMFAGVLAVMGGIFTSMMTGVYFPSAAAGVYLMDSIAAVLIGKTIIKDGQPHILGTFFGVLLISIVRNGITILGLALEYQYIIVGVVFIGSLITEAIFRKRLSEETYG